MINIELVEKFYVDPRQDLISINVGLYEAFLSKNRAGRDALQMYWHLLYSYRRQQTNRVWATDTFLMAGRAMGENRIKKAKALLVSMGIIAYRQDRGEKGRMAKRYIELLLQPNPGPRIEQAPIEQRASAAPWFENRAPAEDEEEEAVDFEEKKSPQKRLFNLYYALHKQRCGTFPRFTRAAAVVLDPSCANAPHVHAAIGNVRVQFRALIRGVQAAEVQAQRL